MSASGDNCSSSHDDSHCLSQAAKRKQINGDRQQGKDTALTHVQSEESIVKEMQNKTSDIIHKEALAIIGEINTCPDSVEDPSNVYSSIEKKTNCMVNTWSEYFSQVEKKEEGKSKRRDDEKFRSVYMEMITEAFVDDLDDLRHGRVESKKGKGKKNVTQGDEVLSQHNVIMPVASEEQILNDDDIKVLVSCLESGMGMWTEDEKQSLVIENRLKHAIANPHITENNLSLHERRRRILFGEAT